MEVHQIIMERWRETLLIPKLLWRYAVRVMTKFISTQKKVEKMDGCYDPYNEKIINKDLDVEIMTCQVLARLYDDTKNNNFDCPWDWKNDGGTSR